MNTNTSLLSVVFDDKKRGGFTGETRCARCHRERPDENDPASWKWNIDSDDCNCFDGDVVAIIHAMGGLGAVFDAFIAQQKWVRHQNDQKQNGQDQADEQKGDPPRDQEAQPMDEHLVLDSNQTQRVHDILQMQSKPPPFRRRTQLLKLEHIVPSVAEMFRPMTRFMRSTSDRVHDTIRGTSPGPPPTADQAAEFLGHTL